MAIVTMAQLTLQQAWELAMQHQRAGRLPQAAALYRQMLALVPNHPESLYMLALLEHQAGRMEASEDLIRHGIALHPDAAAFHALLGMVLAAQARWDDAIDSLWHALDLHPTEAAPVYNNLGTALQAKGRLEEAIAAFREAHLARPRSPEVLNNLGNALRSSGRLEEAVEAFREAVALEPGLTAVHSNLLYTLHFCPGYDARTILAEHRAWAEHHAEPLRRLIQPHDNVRDPERRLRIGYVSPDFRRHVIGYNLLPLFRRHDPAQFEVFCYSQVTRADELTEQFRSHAHAWRDIRSAGDQRVADMVRQDRIDILVDLTLHMAGNHLLVFARRPAPVQVTFAGYPGTTGLSTMDYRLTDPYLDPPGHGDDQYAERPIRLSNSFWCYDPLSGEPLVNPLPANGNGYVTFGCLNNFSKVNAGTLRLWARVMREVPNSRLLLLCGQGGHRQRTCDVLGAEGIDPNRIEFTESLPRERYLGLYHRIDLALDTFPYNGHTTSLDSFWMGVPVVTLVGRTAVSRAGWSHLCNLDLRELAGESEDDFVRIAATLAQDQRRVANLRDNLRERMRRSPLMDPHCFAAGVESAYRQMWRQWCGSTKSTDSGENLPR